MCMAEWEHKDRVWTVIGYQDPYGRLTRQDPGLSFADWLDLQCKGGWEVFKISRNFNSNDDDTWCIFRRLV